MSVYLVGEPRPVTQAELDARLEAALRRTLATASVSKYLRDPAAKWIARREETR